MLPTVATLIGGLGLFLVGLKLLRTGCQALAGPRLRQHLSAWLRSGFLAGLWGLVSALISQSSVLGTSLTASLVAAGVVSVRRALPLLIWAYCGVTVVVLVAVVDLRSFFLVVLGVAGTLWSFGRPARHRDLVAAVLGLGLLFFGLHLVRQAAGALAQEPWFTELLLHNRDNLGASFILGAALSVLTQTALVIWMVAVALAQSGLIGFDQAIMAVLGTSLGVALNMRLRYAGFHGEARQMIMTAVLIELALAAVFTPLILVEIIWGVPLLKALALWLGGEPGMGLAYLVIMCNLILAVILSLVLGPLSRLLARLWPPTSEDLWAKVRFLHPAALAEPATALMLLEREQSRWLDLMPAYAETLRLQDRRQREDARQRLEKAFASLSHELGSFLTELSTVARASATVEGVLLAQDRQRLLSEIEELARGFCAALDALGREPEVERLRHSLVEGGHALLLSARDAARSGQPQEAQILAEITGDRGPLMRRLRAQHLDDQAGISDAQRQALMTATYHFERLVWALHRLARHMQSAAPAAPAPA